MIQTILQQYFLENGQLVLPNIGLLSLNKKDAYFLDTTFTSPKESIIFEPSFDLKPNKLFYIYLSDHLDCTIEQVMIDYTNFMNDQIEAVQSIDLGNLGFLKLKNGVYEYHSNYISDEYFESILLDKVLINDQSENNFNSKSTRWWIFPLILALLAIAAIIIK